MQVAAFRGTPRETKPGGRRYGRKKHLTQDDSIRIEQFLLQKCSVHAFQQGVEWQVFSPAALLNHGAFSGDNALQGLWEDRHGPLTLFRDIYPRMAKEPENGRFLRHVVFDAVSPFCALAQNGDGCGYYLPISRTR